MQCFELPLPDIAGANNLHWYKAYQELVFKQSFIARYVFIIQLHSGEYEYKYSTIFVLALVPGSMHGNKSLIKQFNV